MTTDIDYLPRITDRRRDAHKGDFGHVLVVACSPGMTGAGCMAARAAQRAGAGLVTLALPRDLNHIVEVKLTSAMSLPLPLADTGIMGMQAALRVLDMADRFDLAVVGPGIGQDIRTARMVRKLVAELELPLVLDADGLNAMPGNVDLFGQRTAPTILTPHPGEMKRLAELESTGQVQKDRREVAVKFAADNSVWLALKGNETVVTDGERIYVNPTGNPGMATGGSGDVLTGLVAGLMCQQDIDGFGATCLAVFVHGLAGDLAAQAKGEISMVPEDLLDYIPHAFNIVRGAGAHSESETVELQSISDQLSSQKIDTEPASF